MNELSQETRDRNGDLMEGWVVYVHGEYRAAFYGPDAKQDAERYTEALPTHEQDETPAMGRCHEDHRSVKWTKPRPDGATEEILCCIEPHASIHRRMLTLKGFSPHPQRTLGQHVVCCCGRVGLRPGGKCEDCYDRCPPGLCEVVALDMRPTATVHSDMGDGSALCGTDTLPEDVLCISDFGSVVAEGRLTKDEAYEAHWKRITCQGCLHDQLQLVRGIVDQPPAWDRTALSIPAVDHPAVAECDHPDMGRVNGKLRCGDCGLVYTPEVEVTA